MCKGLFRYYAKLIEFKGECIGCGEIICEDCGDAQCQTEEEQENWEKCINCVDKI